jgi:hypothetical protein
MGRKLVTCVCSFCGNLFDKPKSEYDRNITFNRPNYCNRVCAGKSNVKNINTIQKYDISKHSSNQKDEYSDFRYHLRNIKRRNKDCDITLVDLKNIWEDQKGICVFTGIELKLKNFENPIYSASVDRIDNSKGYIKDNIQWVSRPINLMKNDMSNSDVWLLCDIIKNNLTKKVS